jgi:hypothetical protein
MIAHIAVLCLFWGVLALCILTIKHTIEGK